MSESALTPHLVEWIESRNLAPVLEPMLPTLSGTRRVDCVGYDCMRLVAVEMKPTLNTKAIQQAASCKGYATECWVCCWRGSADMVERAAEAGVGVLLAGEASQLIEVLPTTQSTLEPAMQHEWRDILPHAPRNTIAGTRHAQHTDADTLKAIMKHKEANPHDGWRNIYRAVPSSSPDWQSMKSKYAPRIKRCAQP